MGLFKKKEKVKSKFYFREVPKQPLGKKNIILIVVACLTSLLVLFLVSTYLRWNRDIEDTLKVIASVDEEGKITYFNKIKKEYFEVTDVKDFYGSQYELSLDDDEYAVLYCGSRRTNSGSCYYIDPSNKMENFLRNPLGVIVILVAIILVLIFVILASREKKNKLLNTILSSIIILASGIILGMQVFNVLNYYYRISSNSVVSSTIIGEIKDSRSNDRYLPVLSYNIYDEEYTYASDVKIDSSDNEISLYYNKKDYEDVIVKHNPFDFVTIISGICLFIVGILYTKLSKIEVKEEKDDNKNESN